MDPVDDHYSPDFDGFNSDSYAGSFYSCGSNIEAQSDEEVPSEFPSGGAHHDDTNQNEILESSSRRSNVFVGNRHLPVCPKYRSLDGPTSRCKHCNAQMWSQERVNKGSKKKAPVFSLCCGRGQISLPPAIATPRSLLDLYEDIVKGPRLKSCIRTYNAMLNFSLIGGKIDNSINRCRGPKVFRMIGINRYKMGSTYLSMAMFQNFVSCIFTTLKTK